MNYIPSCGRLGVRANVAPVEAPSGRELREEMQDWLHPADTLKARAGMLFALGARGRE